MDALDSNFVNQSELSEDGKVYLRETARWGKFLSIVGFVFIGFMLILSLFIGGIMSSMMTAIPETEGNGFISAMGGGFLSAIYIVLSLIYFFPVWYLYKFSSKTIKGIDERDSIDLTEGLRNLKSCFKFMGVCTMIILGLYALIFVFGIIGGIAGFGM